MDIVEQIKLKNLSALDIQVINDMHPYDLMKIVDELEEEHKAFLLSQLDDETVAKILAYLEPEHAAVFLAKMGLAKQKEIVELIDPDDAADIIHELSTSDTTDLLDALGTDNKIVQLLAYDDEEAGSLMNNAFSYVHVDDDVKTATRKVIEFAADVSSIQTIFVVDDEHKYVGQLSLKTLLKAKAPLEVKDIISSEQTFDERAKTQDVVDFMTDFSDHDIAIVNNHGVMLGVITVSDIIERFHEEAIDDFEKMSALPETDFKESFLKSALTRLPWLLGLLVLSIAIALITSQFEAVIQATVALAFFQPLILDVGGDVASQTLAVTLITLNDDEGDIKLTGRREALAGVITGISLSVVAFGISYLFSYLINFGDPLRLALVVGISLLSTVFLGLIFGYFTPVVINKLKLDPAVASGPFITTLIDILSLLVYFGLATLLL